MRIATASLNYFTQASKAKSSAAGRKIKLNKADVIGLTEVIGAPMKKGVASGLGPDFNLVGAGTTTPIAYNNKKWELVSWDKRLGTPGEEGFSRDLHVTVAVLQSIKNRRKVITVMATHLTPLTQDGKPRPDYNKRVKKWKTHWNVLRSLTVEYRTLGHPIFIIGDFNDYKAPHDIIKGIHPKAKWVIRNGLDWVFRIPGKTAVARVGITRKFTTGSDHRGVWRNVFLA